MRLNRPKKLHRTIQYNLSLVVYLVIGDVHPGNNIIEKKSELCLLKVYEIFIVHFHRLHRFLFPYQYVALRLHTRVIANIVALSHDVDNPLAKLHRLFYT